MSKKKNLSNQENKPKSSFATLFFLDKEEALILDSYLQYYNHIKHKTFHLINQNNKVSIEQIATNLNINHQKSLKKDILKAYHEKYFNKNITYQFNKFNTHVTQKQNTQLLKEFNITGRQFNSIKKELEGIMSSTLELRETHFKELTEDIKSINKQINNWCKKQQEIINSIIDIIKNNTSVNAKTEQIVKDNNIKVGKQIKIVPKQKSLNSLTLEQEKELTAIIKTQLLKIVKEYQYLLKEKQPNKDINLNININIKTNNSNNPLIVLLEKDKESIKTKINSYCYAKIKEKSLTKKLKVKQNKYNKILWDKLTNTVSICFGSKKLFSQQFLIKDNVSTIKQNKTVTNNLNYLHKNYSDVLFKNHPDWKLQWDFKRQQHLNMVGAKAETTGNQSCIATINRKTNTNDNGSFNFDLRLSDKIIKDNSSSYNFYQGKYLQLKEIDFNEFNIVLETILMNQTTTVIEKKGLKKTYIKKEVQEAISYKISKNEKQNLSHKNLTGYTITFTVNTPKASLIKQGKERFKLSKKEKININSTINNLDNNNSNKNSDVIHSTPIDTDTTVNQVNTKFDELGNKQALDKSLGYIPQGLTLGVIGIDLNYDHVALSETDRHGNLVNTFNLYFNSKVDINNQNKINLKQKSIESQLFNSNYNFLSKPQNHHYHVKEQSSDVKDNMLGNLVKTIIDYAKKVEKPIVIEDLDFTQKKKQMSHSSDVIRYTKTGKRYKTMLSSFFYGTFRNYIERSCYKHDIELIKVNPVYSSLIGLINWSKRNNLTIHQAAALVIARRGQFSTEKKMYVEKVIKNKTTNKNSSNNGNTNKVVKVEVKEKLSFSYKGLICRIDLPVKPQAKGNNQALKQNIIRSQKTSTLVNQWKTVEQEVKKAKKEGDKLIFEKRKLKLTLIKQFKRNTIDENEFSLLS